SGHVYSFSLAEISNQPNQEPDLKIFVVSKDNEGIAGLGGPVQYVRASEAEAYKQEAETARAQAAQLIRETESRVQQALSQYRVLYPAKLKFDYRYSSKAGRPPFSVYA